MLCYYCKAERPDNSEPCASCGEVPDPFLGRVLQDKFEIRKRLGEGGFGAVYEAYHRELESKVAVKTLHAGLSGSSQAVERFKREALATSKLQSPHVVKVFDRGNTQDGILWLAMELVQGENLGERLKRQSHLTEQEVIEIFGPICEALQEAHSKGIIHRDLKPDNIMLTTLENGRPFPKILDFGIAALRGSDGSLTQSGTISGTPKYMAPEQWEGLKRTDARTDLYALGIIAYQCLCGELPFMADSPFGWMNLHYQTPPRPLREQLGERPLSAQAEAAVMKALAKAPADRFESALEFFRVLSGEAPTPKLPLVVPAAAPLAEADPTALAPTIEDPSIKRRAAETLPMTAPSLEGAVVVSAPSGVVARPQKRSPRLFGGALVGVAGLLGVVVYSQLPEPPRVTPSAPPSASAKSTPTTAATMSSPGASTTQAVSAELAAKELWEAAAETERDPVLRVKYEAEAAAQKSFDRCVNGALGACEEIPEGSSYYARARSQMEQAEKEARAIQEKQLAEVNRLLTKAERKPLEEARRLLDGLLKDKDFAREQNLSALKKKVDAAIKALPPTADELRGQILAHKKKQELALMCSKFKLYKKAEPDPQKISALIKELDPDANDFGRTEKTCYGLFPQE